VAVVAAFFWLVALAAFYALTEDQPYIQEWIATGGVAILGTLVVVVAAANWEIEGSRIPARKLLRLWKVPWKVPAGAALVTFEILRAVFRGTISGSWQAPPFRYGELKNPVDVGRRAFESYFQCLAPNSMLVDFKKESDEMLIHRVR
jgi:membrane protease YdiL (CAAX protease family)